MKIKAVSESRWYALRLASVAIARKSKALNRLKEKLTSQYTDLEIAEISRQARILLTQEDKCWLENEGHYILAQNQEAVA